ncbi:exonuclease domain-containing protein [Alkalimarinus sediminis]|uniref:DNA-directed DNA polymerase n=1 Tax=Alkalimarinus sediminis TaxID=1632866 RepID=A0A9E8HPK7_9ALTE|nr:exonuclease domain-containing protein [Alkalimarinus sediminis]UZW74171.1 exonuclease domain-containing protein [Alkalimarinus sediminis]
MSNMLSQTFVFIDLETTGGSAPSDRIIEIGLKKVIDGEVVDEWQSLVNPEKTIPPFIENYTGISNEMVQDAPLFSEVACTLKSKLEGAVFVAHNARFDYSFVKSEFRRIHQPFSAKVLCTVKLSRQLYPQYIKHSMDALIARHELPAGPRHRAMGDVDSMLAFFLHALNERGEAEVETVIGKILKRPSLPSHLPADALDELPQTSGVYRFFGENEVLLYVGKANNIYQRVMSHFISDHNTAKGVMMSQSVRRIEWTETAGELGALLLELKQIKTLKPIHNKRSRSVNSLHSFTLVANKSGYLMLQPVQEVDILRLNEFYGLFKSKKIAEKAIQGINTKNELCATLLGLDRGAGPCFQHKIGRCKGACLGEEDVTRYNLRVQIAFHSLQLKKWPYKSAIGVKERHPFTGKTDIHILYGWVHLGTVNSDEALVNFNVDDHVRACLEGDYRFDEDAYRVITKMLSTPKISTHIIEFN